MRILVQQFANEDNQGEVLDLGTAELTVHKCQLGNRLTRIGCASWFMVTEPEEVDCVLIAGRYFKINEVSFPKHYPDTQPQGEVTLPYQIKTSWTRKEIKVVLIEETNGNIAIGREAKKAVTDV